MKQADFDFLVERRIELIKETLIKKGKEYSFYGEDRLSNFKELACLQKIEPEKSLLNLCDKQYISIHDMVRSILNCTNMLNIPLWREKIGDIINYMILLEALVRERNVSDQSLTKPSEVE